MFGCCKEEDVSYEEIIYAVAGKNQKIKEEEYNDFVKQLGHELAKGYVFIQASRYDQYLQKCKQNRLPFRDEEFPPDESSLNFRKGNRKIEWKRAADIYPEAVLFDGKIEPADIMQGNIGDCYFLAALASLAEQEQNIYSIFCNITDPSQFGIYKLTVSNGGVPQEFVIDDYLPVFSDNPLKTAFCKARNNRELWVVLLEKAWAKMNGSYGNIQEGSPHQVLTTFSLAPCLHYQINPTISSSQKQQIWKIIKNASNMNFPSCCSTRKKYVCKGLNPGHTYSLLSAHQVEIGQENSIYNKQSVKDIEAGKNGKRKRYRILKMRNPWGNTEYTGDCSENDTKFWSKADKAQQQEIFTHVQNDGIFTIPYNQMISNFQTIDIVHLHKGYNKDYEVLTLNNNQETYLSLFLQQGCQLYLTMQKSYNHKNGRAYGWCKLILMKKEGDKYTFIDGRVELNFPDIAFHCHVEAGDYVILGLNKAEWEKTEKVSFGVYSQSIMKINFMAADPSILKNLFYNHALASIKKPSHPFDIRNQLADSNRNPGNKNISLPQQTKIGSNDDDWIISCLLHENGGYGYMAFSLSPGHLGTVRIQFSHQQLKAQGFHAIGCPENYCKKIKAGQSEVLVFSIDPLSQRFKDLTIHYPPKAVIVTLDD